MSSGLSALPLANLALYWAFREDWWSERRGLLSSTRTSPRRKRPQLPTLYYWSIWSLLSLGWHGLGDVTDWPINTWSLASWSVCHHEWQQLWPHSLLTCLSDGNYLRSAQHLARVDHTTLMKTKGKKKVADLIDLYVLEVGHCILHATGINRKWIRLKMLIFLSHNWSVIWF